jgi:ABC-type nitrate/sulfonate/bicarbonate transport system permease component
MNSSFRKPATAEAAPFGGIAGRWASSILAIGTLLILWQIASAMLSGAHLLPGPAEIVGGVARDWRLYPHNIAATGSVAIRGFIIGNLVAIALAVACVLVPRSEGPIMQIALIAYAVPVLAVAPILVVLFEGDRPRVIVSALSVFFTTLVGVHTGLRHVDNTSLDLIAAFGGGRWAQLVKVRFWACLPYLFAALKIAAPSALLGAMIAEFLGADHGLGVALVVSEQNLDAVRTLGIGAVTATIAGIAYGLVGLVGKWAVQWAPTGAGVASRAEPISQSVGRSGLTRYLGRVLSTAAVIIFLLAVWWGMIASLHLDPLSAKTPADVLHYLFRETTAAAHRIALASALGQTLGEAFLGYIAGMAIGCLFAAGTSLSRTIEHAVLPIAMVLRSVPLAALTPIVTLIFGHGLPAVAAVAGVVVFFPTYVNVLLGLRSASREVTDLMHAYGGSPSQVFFKARVPSAIPAFMASARIAVPSALIGVLVAEWLVSGGGVGQYMIESQQTLDYAALWSAAVGLTVASALLYALVGGAERIVLRRLSGFGR